MYLPSTTRSLPELLRTASHEPNNLFSLLSKYRVIVPGIQRHYVQGENTVKAKEVRTTFIRDILRNMMPDPKPLNLDFIYGPIDTVGADAFVPVDGQQRLTTLWLLARYFAESLDEQARPVVLKLLSRFTYEDRIHATRFCQAFTSADNSFFNHDKAPSDAIKQSKWFNPYWVADCTVAGMLNTLDTIDSIKRQQYPDGTAEECLNYMCSHLTFQLCVDQFADDIYMKMNARGLTLTQWENFKGRFAEMVKDAVKGDVVKVNWDTQIESVSDSYYDCMQDLPDSAFLAFMARIVVYEAKIAEVDVADNVAKVAKHTDWSKDLPHVPFDEFIKLFERVAPVSVANTFLTVIAKVATKETVKLLTPYWQRERTLIQSLCHPKNRNELDFSLCVYEYFKKFTDPNIEDFTLALRLIWNILENVNVDDKVNLYNRVTGIRQIIQKGCQSLYSKGMTDGGDNAAAQYAEEAVKASVYSAGEKEDIALMQDVEESMHGRIRLGVLDLKGQNVPVLNRFNRERLTVLNKLFELYTCPENRKHIVLMVVAAEPYALQDAITLRIENDDLRKLLSTKDDKWLQIALLDFLVDRQQDIMGTVCSDILTANGSFCSQQQWWERDWRNTVVQVGVEQKGYEVYADKLWGRSVRWHNRGRYYLYCGSTIRNALPINDYRIDLLLPDNREIYGELGKDFENIEMNDAETRSGMCKFPDKRGAAPIVSRYIYFYSDHIEVRERNHVDKTFSLNKSLSICDEEMNAIHSVKELLNALRDKLA